MDTRGYDGGVTYNSVTWGIAGEAACGTCHGNNDVTQPKSTSHDFHLRAYNEAISKFAGYQYSCSTCHDSVVTTTADATVVPTIDDKSLHVNGAYNVAAGGGYSFTPAGSPTTCTGNGCHGDLTWGQTGPACRDCHRKTGAGDQDVDDYTYGNATTDIYGYEHAPIAKNRTWIAGKHGGEASTIAVGEDYDAHLVDAAQEPEPSQPFTTAR